MENEASPVRIRPTIKNIPAYVPGKPAPANALKLSSNENPYPPSDAVLKAISAQTDLNRYPDMLCSELREALAEVHSLTPDQIFVGNGSSAVLLHALTTVCEPGREVVFAWRSFESYPIAVPTVGARPVPIPLTPDYGHDIAALVDAVGPQTAAVILCSPNNPTGRTITAGEAQALLDMVPQHVLVILDEAYCDFVTDSTAVNGLELLADYPNLLLLRTFSKAYSLAGLRVGYGLGAPQLVQAIAKVSTPFGVSAVGQAAARAALQDSQSQIGQIQTLIEQRELLIPALRDSGWVIPDSQANFFWIPQEPNADLLGDIEGFTARCAQQGIIVRPFPQGIRISLGLPAENERLLEVLTSPTQD